MARSLGIAVGGTAKMSVETAFNARGARNDFLRAEQAFSQLRRE
jgi:hypothetical protein